MTEWSPTELDRIGAANELSITTRRADGSLRAWTPIWVVRVGDELYVRSWKGAGGAWYRHAVRTGATRVRASGIERDVTVENVPADDAAHPAIDAQYRAKYGAHSSYVAPMVAPAAVEATLRLIPA